MTPGEWAKVAGLSPEAFRALALQDIQRVLKGVGRAHAINSDELIECIIPSRIATGPKAIVRRRILNLLSSLAEHELSEWVRPGHLRHVTRGRKSYTTQPRLWFNPLAKAGE